MRTMLKMKEVASGKKNVAPPRWKRISPGSRPSPIRDKIGHRRAATSSTSPSPSRKRCTSIAVEPLGFNTAAGLSVPAHAKLLLPPLESALRPATRVLPDLGRVDRAGEFGDAFDDRSGGAFRGGPGRREGGGELVGRASLEEALAGPEGELARAQCNVDVARLANDGIRGDGNLPIGRKADGAVAAEQPRHGAAVEGAEHRRMRGHYAGERQGRRAGRVSRPRRCGRHPLPEDE